MTRMKTQVQVMPQTHPMCNSTTEAQAATAWRTRFFAHVQEGSQKPVTAKLYNMQLNMQLNMQTYGIVFSGAMGLLPSSSRNWHQGHQWHLRHRT